MPSKPKSASPSHADLLAEAQAAWQAAAPVAQLKGLREGVDYTATTYAAAFHLSRLRAQSHLASLTEGDGALFDRGLFRLPGYRQAQYVYWPKVAGRPT